MKNRILFLIFAMVLPLAMLAQQRYVVTTQELNVRTAPSANSKVVDKVRQGDIVSVVSINNTWAKIVYKKKERYVSSKYLSRLEDNSNQNYQNSYNDQSQSYDLIVLKNGHNIQGKVIEVNKEVIIYQPKDNSINSSVNIAAVQYIRYANGAQKNFTTNSNQYAYQQKTSYSEQEDITSETPGSFGLFYLADFKAAGKGVYGLKGDTFVSQHFGVSFSLGTNTGLVDPSSFDFRIGPSFYAEIQKPLYVTCPLRFVGDWTFGEDERGNSKTSFGWGIDLAPGLMLYSNKWSLQVSAIVQWTEGSDKLGTGFMVGFGYNI